MISYDWSKELHLFTKFRLMKKVCVLNYYSIFPLQKFSPYTDLFSEHALRYLPFVEKLFQLRLQTKKRNFFFCLIFPRYQEHGFSEYWYSVIYRDYGWYETFFEDYPLPDNEPKALTTSSVIAALILLCVNTSVATVVFVLEVLYKKRRMLKSYEVY